MNDLVKLLAYAAVATGFGLAAQRCAARIGLPAAVVPVAGAITLAALTNLSN